MACQWRRIDQEEPFVGRAAEVGDELGSQVLAARLVRDAIRMCFLQERLYAPYGKWLGSAFGRLDAAAALTEHLLDAVGARQLRSPRGGTDRDRDRARTTPQHPRDDSSCRRAGRPLPLAPVSRARIEPVRRRVPRRRRRPIAAMRCRSSAPSTSGWTRRTCSANRVSSLVLGQRTTSCSRERLASHRRAGSRRPRRCTGRWRPGPA